MIIIIIPELKLGLTRVSEQRFLKATEPPSNATEFLPELKLDFAFLSAIFIKERTARSVLLL